MKKEIISQLHSSFEIAVNETEGVEYWFARDLQLLLGYNEWRNFLKVIDKAIIACETSKQKALDHFVDVNKMVDVGSVAKREIADIKRIISFKNMAKLKSKGFKNYKVIG